MNVTAILTWSTNFCGSQILLFYSICFLQNDQGYIYAYIHICIGFKSYFVRFDWGIIVLPGHKSVCRFFRSRQIWCLTSKKIPHNQVVIGQTFHSWIWLVLEMSSPTTSPIGNIDLFRVGGHVICTVSVTDSLQWLAKHPRWLAAQVSVPTMITQFFKTRGRKIGPNFARLKEGIKLCVSVSDRNFKQ